MIMALPWMRCRALAQAGASRAKMCSTTSTDTALWPLLPHLLHLLYLHLQHPYLLHPHLPHPHL
jgi:hypothetical protein